VPQQSSVRAQQLSNSVSGYVYGVNRTPVADLNVEFLDNFDRSIRRTRTNSSGFYEFSLVPGGNYKVRVYTFGTDYEEQVQAGEIVNFLSTTPSGATRVTGSDRQQMDFYLRLRKGVTLAAASAIFAQEVPAQARELYDKALIQLENKNTGEGIIGLKSAIEAFPQFYAALERLGTEYLRMGRPETLQAAEVLLALAVGINTRSFKGWYALAYARYSLAKHPEALTAIKKATELNSGSPDAVFLHGSLLRYTKRYAEAEKQLLKARELSKDTNAQIHWELALLYGNGLKRYADAARELKLFLKAQPDARDSENIKKLILDFEKKALTKTIQ